MQEQFFYKKFFEGKRVTKQGFGYLGRGFGVVKFLLECGAVVTVTDMKERTEFEEQIKELENLGYKEIKIDEDGKGVGQIRYVFGKHEIENFVNCNFVIQASGVAKESIYLQAARNAGVPIYQESSLFVKLVKENFNDVKIVGVTGTRGKTTTTFLIYEVLTKYFAKVRPLQEARANKVEPCKIHLGGNVQGVATLELIKNIKEGDVVVMELDSWILQGFGDIKYSPNIAVFTSFMPDHMNYYKGDMKEYFLDKVNIFLYQRESDIFVTTNAVGAEIEKYLGQEYKFNSQHIELVSPLLKEVDDKRSEVAGGFYETYLIGQHNQIAINLAWRAVKSFGISEEEFRDVVKEFKGVKGRLEFIKEININKKDGKVGSVKIYNDTCSTTPDATIVGLNALHENLEEKGKTENKIILICGGRDKELNLDNLINKFLEMHKENRLEIILLNDETTTGTKRLLEGIKNKNLQGEINWIEVKNLEEGIKEAFSFTNSGDIILFSPGFASFGMFKNEYDRGDKFVHEVDKYVTVNKII
jgi:UDP-N-acetylmuramoylalanine--D-glutamate ligase